VPEPEESTATTPPSPTAQNPVDKGTTRLRLALVRLRAWRVQLMPLGLVAIRPDSPTATKTPLVRQVTPRNQVELKLLARRTQLVPSSEV
jgi:hypothetical protein